MNTDLSILHLVKEASFIVQFVMLILLVTSVISWTVIFTKYKELKQFMMITEEFEEKFWSGINLTDLYRNLTAENFEPAGIEKIFIAGYREFSRMKSKNEVAPAIPLENAQRAMRIEMNRELGRLEQHLPWLATVGSISPYIGLFGTVWGIMNSFRVLGNVQQASLAQVAPGIAEALIATAIGLFAAIPAVIGYNRFTTNVECQSVRLELFVEEFIVLLQRQVYS